MSERAGYLLAYTGELTPDDSVALDRPGFRVYLNGVGHPVPFWLPIDQRPTEPAIYQLVRVEAESEQDAHDQLVAALGRKPDGLTVLLQD